MYRGEGDEWFRRIAVAIILLCFTRELKSKKGCTAQSHLFLFLLYTHDVLVYGLRRKGDYGLRKKSYFRCRQFYLRKLIIII